MSESWKRWEGHVVNGKFPLQRYLGGSDHCAVFTTQYGEGGSQRAAIKLTLADPNNAEAIVSRGKLAAKLSDPGLIRIFDVGRSKLDGTEILYVVMELADEDLSQILPQRPLTREETQEMLSPVLDALAYLHSKGFVHGSIKPSNVMAIADRVKISSDSLCALQEATGRERGMSRYAPPEGAGGLVSPAADVWALGMTLVEVLTQRLPVPDPSQPGTVLLPDGMPEPFLAIARHCLRADPRERWTIADIAARLKSMPVATRVTQTLAPASRSEKRSFAKWLYVMAVAASGLVALLWMSGSKAKTSNPPDQSALVEAHQGQPADSPHPVQPKPSPAASTKTQPAQETEEPRTSAAATPPVATTPSGTSRKPEGVVHTVIPTVTQSARNTIQGRVKVAVRVKVNTSGDVVSAVLNSPGPSKYFARLALESAQGWRFAPVPAHGQSVASEWILRFTFSRIGTEVVPKQTSP